MPTRHSAEKSSRRLDLRAKFRRAVWAGKINWSVVGKLMAFQIKTLNGITQGIRGTEERRLGCSMRRGLRGGGSEQGGKPRDCAVIKEKAQPPVPSTANRLAAIAIEDLVWWIFLVTRFPRSHSALLLTWPPRSGPQVELELRLGLIHTVA